jgi:hypothetical protein
MTLITDDIAGTQLYGGPLTFSNQRYYNPSLIHGYPAASTANAITAMSQSGSTVTVTVASMPALKYSVALIPTNQQIVITGAAVAGYNGVWPIIADAVPGVNGTVTFTANQTGLGATATGTMTYYLGGAFNWTPKPSAAVGLQFEQCMKGNRVRVSINGSNPNPGDVDGIAFCSSSQFGLMLYNLNIGCSTGGANYYDAAINRSPTITITNLPFSGSRTLNVYRLDSSNGNLDGLIQAGTTPTYTYATGVGNTTAQNTVVNGSVTVTSGSCTITGAIYGTLPANSVVFIQIT